MHNQKYLMLKGAHPDSLRLFLRKLNELNAQLTLFHKPDPPT